MLGREGLQFRYAPHWPGANDGAGLCILRRPALRSSASILMFATCMPHGAVF